MANITTNNLKCTTCARERCDWNCPCSCHRLFMTKVGKNDSKKKSMVETLTDILIGFLVFLPVNFFVLPLFVEEIAEQSVVGILSLSAIYTSIAIV